MAKTRRKFTKEDKQRIVDAINADVAAGKSYKDAIAAQGIYESGYRKWKRQLSGDTIKRKSSKPRRWGYTPQQRADFVETIKEMLAKGIKINDAAKEVGINPSSYYLWIKEPRLRKTASFAVPDYVERKIGKPPKAEVNLPLETRVALELMGMARKLLNGEWR